tara:strand:- start:872 stop:1060 length:189 start_codon:yes stop_codon:yes gene_type:complete
MNTSSTNKKIFQELEEIGQEITEQQELNFETLTFEDNDWADVDDDYYEPTEAEEWYDFDPDC